MLENLVVIGIVLVAGAYLGRVYLRKIRTRSSCGCGCNPDTCAGTSSEHKTQ